MVLVIDVALQQLGVDQGGGGRGGGLVARRGTECDPASSNPIILSLLLRPSETNFDDLGIFTSYQLASSCLWGIIHHYSIQV